MLGAGTKNLSECFRTGKRLELLEPLKHLEQALVVERLEPLELASPTEAQEADTVLGVPLSEHFLKPFTAYTEFCRFAKVTPFTFGNQESYLVGQRIIDEIRFVCLNSAWFAKDDNDKGKLWLGLPHLKYLEAHRQLDLAGGAEAVPITIALMHHPPDWRSVKRHASAYKTHECS